MSTTTREPDQIDRLIENLINGNITDAKAGATKVSSFRISMRLRQVYSWSFERAAIPAAFLHAEPGVTFQQYCDTK